MDSLEQSCFNLNNVVGLASGLLLRGDGDFLLAVTCSRETRCRLSVDDNDVIERVRPIDPWLM